MKYCSKCGKQLLDEAVICTGCGCAVSNPNPPTSEAQDDLSIIIKIFMIIGCVVGGLSCLFPLVWMIPMTISLFEKLKRREKIGTGFKVCVLLFVNLIAGILLLCRSDDE